MAEQLKSTENPGGGPAPGGFWVTAKAWWDGATTDSASVKRNLAMLGGVTLAAMLCIWSLRSARSSKQATCSCTMCWQGHPRCHRRLAIRGATCGCSSMAEHQLPKLTVRVRFPSSAPMKNRQVEGGLPNPH